LRGVWHILAVIALDFIAVPLDAPVAASGTSNTALTEYVLSACLKKPEFTTMSVPIDVSSSL
jgi:hypothetical protein